MKKITLTQGRYTLVDDEDYLKVGHLKWYYHKSGYARRHATINGQKKTTSLHQTLIHCPPGYWTDHINGNSLDNRRTNLRVATPAQNAANRHVSKNRFKGISWARSRSRWRAKIRFSGVHLELGYFNTAEEAALAYNDAAIQIFGEYAYLNTL